MKKVKGFAFAGAAVLLSLVMMFVGCTEKLQTNGSASAMQDPASLEQVYEVGLQEESPAQETLPTGTVHLEEVPDEETSPAENAQEEEIGEESAQNAALSEEITMEEAYSFAIYETAYRLSELGYDVYRGAAVTADGQKAFGLVYTLYEENADGGVTCGFLELVDETAQPVITQEAIEQGVAAAVSSDDGTQTYSVDRIAALKDSSGIYGDWYFTAREVSGCAMRIEVSGSAEAEFDESIDCIDYNRGRTLWLGDAAPAMSFEADSLYTADEAAAYSAAAEMLQKIAALQDANAYEGEGCSLILIETALLESTALNGQNGMIGTEEGGYYDLSELNGIEMEENQIVVVTRDEGVQIVTIPTEEELQAAADARMASGFIKLLSNLFLAIGSITVCVVTCGTAAPLVAAVCVATTAVSTVYAVSNIAEGVSDIYYASKGDVTSEAFNPVKELLEKAIGDEQTANTVYHAIGITSSLLQSLILPANAALQAAHAAGAGVGGTILLVTRAVAVETLKIAATAAVSMVSSVVISDVTADLTGSQAAGMIAGFAGALFSGFLTYKGLTLLDQKFNFSGLYTKVSLGKIYSEANLRESALRQFGEKNWNAMSMAEKKSAVENLARVVAGELGLKNPPQVKFYSSNDRTYGYFSDSKNALYINTKYFNTVQGSRPAWVEIVDTVAHEMRHAYQYARVLAGIQDDVTNSYIHYIPESKYGYYMYRWQPCEADAFDYGSLWADLLIRVLGI